MLFNSYEFVLIFLPIVWVGYFLIGHVLKGSFAHLWLLGSSLFFYSWQKPENLILILTSILGNYWIGSKVKGRFPFLVLGLFFNIALLGYFKYIDFIIENINMLFDTAINQLYVDLPLGISFFTFQQIAYLVDRYYYRTDEKSFSSYGLFVSFFPQLVAGPIVHHKEIMPQFFHPNRFMINGKNIVYGLFFFSIGLGKKVLIADSLSDYVGVGFASASTLSFLDSWVASLSYTLQLYFDFSGYCDMAVGLGRMFNIMLPFNFSSPYQAENIQDFWRRWHITLGEFLRNYLYIPLGGNRGTKWKKYRNILTVFTIGGLWHGAGWTYIFWGVLHGSALVVHELWKKIGFKIPSLPSLAITFIFCNIAWVFFRAESWTQSIDFLQGMLGRHGTQLLIYSKAYCIGIGVLLIILRWLPNTEECVDKLRYSKSGAVLAAIFLVFSILRFQRVSEFIYFNF